MKPLLGGLASMKPPLLAAAGRLSANASALLASPRFVAPASLAQSDGMQHFLGLDLLDSSAMLSLLLAVEAVYLKQGLKRQLEPSPAYAFAMGTVDRDRFLPPKVREDAERSMGWANWLLGTSFAFALMQFIAVSQRTTASSPSTSPGRHLLPVLALGTEAVLFTLFAMSHPTVSGRLTYFREHLPSGWTLFLLLAGAAYWLLPYIMFLWSGSGGAAGGTLALGLAALVGLSAALGSAPYTVAAPQLKPVGAADAPSPLSPFAADGLLALGGPAVFNAAAEELPLGFRWPLPARAVAEEPCEEASDSARRAEKHRLKERARPCPKEPNACSSLTEDCHACERRCEHELRKAFVPVSQPARRPARPLSVAPDLPSHRSHAALRTQPCRSYARTSSRRRACGRITSPAWSRAIWCQRTIAGRSSAQRW